MKRLTLLLLPLCAIALTALPAAAKPLCLSGDEGIDLFLKKVGTKKGRFGSVDGVAIGGGGDSRTALTGAYAVAPDGSLVSISVSLGSESVFSGGVSNPTGSKRFYELRWVPGAEKAFGQFYSIGQSTDWDPATMDVVDCKDLL